MYGRTFKVGDIVITRMGNRAEVLAVSTPKHAVQARYKIKVVVDKLTVVFNEYASELEPLPALEQLARVAE